MPEEKSKEMQEITGQQETLEEALARLEAEVSKETRLKKEEQARQEAERRARQEAALLERLEASRLAQAELDRRRQAPTFAPDARAIFSGTKSTLGGRVTIEDSLFYVAPKTYEQYQDMKYADYARAVEMLAQEVLVQHPDFNAGYFIPVGSLGS